MPTFWPENSVLDEGEFNELETFRPLRGEQRHFKQVFNRFHLRIARICHLFTRTQSPLGRFDNPPPGSVTWPLFVNANPVCFSARLDYAFIAGKFRQTLAVTREHNITECKTSNVENKFSCDLTELACHRQLINR